MELQEFEVHGIKISLRTSEDPRYLQALFNLVDKKMTDLNSEFPEMSQSQLAIMANIYLLDDFIGRDREEFVAKEKIVLTDINKIASTTQLMIKALNDVL